MAKKKHDKQATAEFFGEGDVEWFDDEDGEGEPASSSEASPPDNGAGHASGSAAVSMSSAPAIVISDVPTDASPPPPPDSAEPPSSPAVSPPTSMDDTMPKTVAPTEASSDDLPDPGPASPLQAGAPPFDPERTHPFMEAPNVARLLAGDAVEEPEADAPPGPASTHAEATDASTSGAEIAAVASGGSAAQPPPIPAAPAVRPPKGMTPRPAPARQVLPTARQRERREEGWRGVLAALVAEAGATGPGEGRGRLLERAAQVAATQLDDLERAAALYAQARAAGQETLSLLRTQLEVLGRLGRYAEQQSMFVELSARLEGPARADALVNAALVAWRRLGQPTQAVEHLRSAARVEPENYPARALLRSLWPGIGTIEARQHLNLLDELAALSEGGIAADFLIEASNLAAGSGPAQVQARLERALGADPGHTVAFLRLEHALKDDPAALAGLYDAEATRDGQSDPGWWHSEAARAHQRAGNAEAAVRDFNASVRQGYPFALRELQGTYVQAGSWFELEDALAREAEVLSVEEGLAFALYRLGWLREARLENREAALEAYQGAVEADPASAPSADAVARLLRGHHDQQLAFWRDRMERATLPAERRYLTLQLAEAAELLADHESAREHFRTVLADARQDTAAEVARAGLERVLKRLQDRKGLADLRRQQATMASSPSERALYLHEAASILSGPMPSWPPDDESEREAAISALQSALDAEPDHPATLGSMYLLLEASNRWRQLANVMQAAGDAAGDPQRRAAHLYRAGRLFAERANDDAAACTCLGQALLSDPAFRPARWLLRTVSGPNDAAGDASVYREEAKHAEGRSERAWGLFAAAEAAGPGPTARRDLQRILSENPDHAGALAALEVQCVADGDEEALVDIYLRALEGPATPTKARVGARAALLLMRAGKGARAVEVLRRVLGMDVEGRPLRAGSRLALKLGDAELALEMLEPLDASEDVVERARLIAEQGRAQESLRVLLALVEADPGALVAAARAATLAQQLERADAELRAYAAIARHATHPSLAAAYGTWTGMQLQAAGKDEEAAEFWTIAHGARPTSAEALEGRVKGLVARSGVDEIKVLLKDAEPERLAMALAEAGATAEAADGLRTSLVRFESDARRLASLLLAERLFEEAGDWDSVYGSLVERRSLSNDPQMLLQLEERQRWILAEHLAQTDAAWETYKKLHEESPSDRGVTEALARIAGARGEVETAIGYLKDLGKTAPSPQDAARYQRRVGEVYERAGRQSDARQAYLAALEHVPTDGGALDGLKRLAEGEQDWPGLIAVLQREASLAEGERKVDLRRQIAEITEQHIPDPQVAIDAWRTLVELAPRDRSGLERLLGLAEAQQDWELFVEVGATFAQILSGPDRGAMLRRVGVACEDQLGRDDAVRFYQLAVAQVPPDPVAAQRLERVARARADWGAAIEALALQAKADVASDAQVAALLAAARLEIEARHDRGAAAAFYRQVLEIQPNNEPALRFMSTHLFEAGRFGEAMPAFRRLEPMVERGQDIDDFDTRMELSTFFFYFAEMLRRQGNPGEALIRYERALALNATHLPSLTAVGPLYVEAERWGDAERVYRTLLQLSGGHGDPESVATTYTQLGLVERQLGHADKAYKRFNKALEVHQNHVGALKGMALVMEDRNEWGNLLNVYNNIIYHATDPEDVVEAYMTKGRILDVHMGRQDKANQHYQRCLDFDPHQPVAYLRLAELALRRDAYRDAGTLAERALQLDEDLVRPHRAMLLLVRAAAWESAGRRSEAQRCLREAGVLDRALPAALGDDALGDLAGLKQVIANRLP